MPEPKRFLVLSCTHLPVDLTAHDLDKEPGVVAVQFEHGWFLWVPEDPDVLASLIPDIPAEVLAVQRYARARDCDYVLLRDDADPIPELPVPG